MFWQVLLKYAARLVYWGTLIAGIVTAVFDFVLETVIGLTEWALENLSTLSGANFVGTLTENSGILATANHFVPLAEMWALMLLTVPYMLTIVTIRFVKQFIPTVSN